MHAIMFTAGERSLLWQLCSLGADMSVLTAVLEV